MDELWAQYEPLVHEGRAQWRTLFQNADVVLPKSWTPSGDWFGDMFSAWDAAWTGTITSNATHSVLHSRDYRCDFLGTHQLVPELRELYPVDKELTFDGTPLSSYMRAYPEVPLVAVIAYVVMVFGGQLVMKLLPAMQLKFPLALWNLLLSAFSWMGVIRTVPHLAATVRTYGLYHAVCAPVCETYGGGAAGLWSFLFIISKFPELVDTVFLVLRKRPVIFLHWYHHVTVLLYCWQSYATQTSAGIFFICMNYSVHAIMYGYYFLQIVKMWPRFIPPWIITILQLSQMVGGIWVCYLTFKYQEQDHKPCSTASISFKSGVVMYASYFVLFLQILIMLLSGGHKKAQRSSRKEKTQ